MQTHRTIAATLVFLSAILLIALLLGLSGQSEELAALSIPGSFLISAFSYGAFYIPLYLLAGAYLLLRNRFDRTDIVALTASILPFLTTSLALKTLFEPTASPWAKPFVLIFGKFGGSILLFLFSVLLVILIFSVRSQMKLRSTTSSAKPKPVRRQASAPAAAAVYESAPEAGVEPALEAEHEPVAETTRRREKKMSRSVDRSRRGSKSNGKAYRPILAESRFFGADSDVEAVKPREDTTEAVTEAEPNEPLVIDEVPTVDADDAVDEVAVGETENDANMLVAVGAASATRSDSVAQVEESVAEAPVDPEPTRDAGNIEDATFEYVSDELADEPIGFAPEDDVAEDLDFGGTDDDVDQPDSRDDDLDGPDPGPELDTERRVDDAIAAAEPMDGLVIEQIDSDVATDEETDVTTGIETEDDTDEDLEEDVEVDTGVDTGLDLDDEVEAEDDLNDDEAEPEDVTDVVITDVDTELAADVDADESSEQVLIDVTAKQKKPGIPTNAPYDIPLDGLLEEYAGGQYWKIDADTQNSADVLKNTLEEFKIKADVTGIRKGPVITMFEILPAPGVKLSKIVNLADNIALRLAASRVRIVAPIPGKHAVGIEVPNRNRAIVSFREMILDDAFKDEDMAIPIALGKDIPGEAQIIDLTRTPHLLIAGATGSGKSVCVNSIISSILYRRRPSEVKLLLIDPKIVELKLYNDIPHLLTPVITEPKRAFQALQYCLSEMERRYSLLDALGVRDIKSFNKKIKKKRLATLPLPYIVIVVDEFADLMSNLGKDLETTLARLAAMSRAVGIHLVLATQRPSVDVITGLIKANIPSRIAFMVASKFDSRIIIDSVGAEKLLGRGDMLLTTAWNPIPIRIQGAFLSEDEVELVTDHIKTLGEPDYIDDEIFIDEDEEADGYYNEGEVDPLMNEALEIVVRAGKASASYLQRRLKIGYNRAARLVEEMEERGIVGPQQGSKPREILRVPD